MNLTFKGQLVTVLFPGFLLIVLGGALIDVAHAVGVTIGTLGFLLLICWPLLVLVVEVRHARRAKRARPALPPKDRVYDFVIATKRFTFVFALPVSVLGGLGVFCLVTAAQGREDPVLRTVVGIGSLLMMVGCLLFLVRGRTRLTLRMMGVALFVFATGATGWAITALMDGVGFSDCVVLLAGLGMLTSGAWLAVTGRNSFRGESTMAERAW